MVDGHILHCRRPPAVRGAEEVVPFHERQPCRGQTRLWAQNIIHVSRRAVDSFLTETNSKRSTCRFVAVLFFGMRPRSRLVGVASG